LLGKLSDKRTGSRKHVFGMPSAPCFIFIQYISLKGGGYIAKFSYEIEKVEEIVV
jgi:hypothetical protein